MTNLFGSFAKDGLYPWIKDDGKPTPFSEWTVRQLKERMSYWTDFNKKVIDENWDSRKLYENIETIARREYEIPLLQKEINRRMKKLFEKY